MPLFSTVLALDAEPQGQQIYTVAFATAGRELWQKLSRLERKLTLGQAMVYRTHVALLHSK